MTKGRWGGNGLRFVTVESLKWKEKAVCLMGNSGAGPSTRQNPGKNASTRHAPRSTGLKECYAEVLHFLFSPFLPNIHNPRSQSFQKEKKKKELSRLQLFS